MNSMMGESLRRRADQHERDDGGHVAVMSFLMMGAPPSVPWIRCSGSLGREKRRHAEPRAADTHHNGGIPSIIGRHPMLVPLPIRLFLGAFFGDLIGACALHVDRQA
jgi:hypothetical protein